MGQTAHLVLKEVVRGASSNAALRDALGTEGVDAGRLARILDDAAWSSLAGRLEAMGPRADAGELERVDRIVRDVSRFLAGLLAAARRRTDAASALEGAFAGSEVPFDVTVAEGIALTGRIDFLTRNVESDVTWVIDLKTWLPDDVRAVETQVRLYAGAFAMSGQDGIVPGLVCLSGDRAVLHEFVEPVPQVRAEIETRIRHAGQWLKESVNPPAANDRRHCVGCAVRDACWERFGPTLPTTGGVRADVSAPASAAPVGANVSLASRLQSALTGLGFPPEECDGQRAVEGPRVVLWRVRLRPDASLSRLQARAEDLARVMEWTPPPRIENVAGEPYVGIAAPRADVETVPLEPALAELGRVPSALPVPLGVTLDRRPRWLDLATAPHVLVAGTTQSGKSVFLKSLALAILEQGRASLVIVDPKRVDFGVFRGARGLEGGEAITETEQAVERVQRLVTEMEARTDRLAASGAPDWLEAARRGHEIRPLVVIIDEFADLMDSLKKNAKADFDAAVIRLAQRSRAVGIHLVLAAQRPTTDVVSGRLKTNLPVRIAFRLVAQVDSQTILDESGAERLLGSGDMLVRRAEGVERLQAYWADPSVIERRVAALR